MVAPTFSSSASESHCRPVSPTQPLSKVSTTESLSSSVKTTIKISQSTRSTTNQKGSYSLPNNTNNVDPNPAKLSSSCYEDDNNKSSLETRMAKLEEELATLSQLLLTVTTKEAPINSPIKSRPLLLSSFEVHSPELSPTQSTVPYLESPYLTRCLSHTILREESPSLRNFRCHPFGIDEDSIVVANPSEKIFSHPQRRRRRIREEKENSYDNRSPTKEKIAMSKGEEVIEPKEEGKKPFEKAQEVESKGNEQEQPLPKKTVRQKWMDYLESFQEPKPDVDNQMEEFVKVPSQLEGLLAFGLAICFDSFLYFLTMLPIKFLWSTFLLLKSPFSKVDKYKFHRRHFYNMIQVCNAYVVYRFILVPISIGQLYHWIRGQAMLKLYVLIAIVEVFDRLMCSMGQDCLDSMYWNTTKRPRSKRMLVSVTVVLVYTMCHTILLFIHVATLNVAINSADHALLTLLISGNFAEIKSTVFKKYNKTNLFKITASDICERFKLVLFLALVLILNVSQGMDWKTTIKMSSMCGIVMAAEFVADWIKHSFITKFNSIQSKIYPQYSLLLAGDVTGIGHEGVNLDHSHAVVKRLGFAQIPLVCVMLRFMTEALRYYAERQQQSGDGDEYHYRGWLAMQIVIIWSLLCVFKLLLGAYLQRICTAKLEAAPELKKTPININKKRV